MDSGHLCSSYMVKLNGVLPILASMLEMVSDLLLVQHSVDIEKRSNVGRSGVYIFRVDQCSIIGPNG